MDYLATQSANGTYDNEVDRKNLQKEVDALCDEINRIADSANFNGIKLLDGSLSGTATSSSKSLVTGRRAGRETLLSWISFLSRPGKAGGLSSWRPCALWARGGI